MLAIAGALLSSVVGNASGYGLLVAEVVRVVGDGTGTAAQPPAETPAWRATALWCLLSPLVWSLPGMPNFVTLTVLVNAVNVIVLPFLTVSSQAIAAVTCCSRGSIKLRHASILRDCFAAAGGDLVDRVEGEADGVVRARGDGPAVRAGALGHVAVGGLAVRAGVSALLGNVYWGGTLFLVRNAVGSTARLAYAPTRGPQPCKTLGRN